LPGQIPVYFLHNVQGQRQEAIKKAQPEWLAFGSYYFMAFLAVSNAERPSVRYDSFRRQSALVQIILFMPEPPFLNLKTAVWQLLHSNIAV